MKCSINLNERYKMLRIRLSMGGVRKRPIYKIVIADSRYPRDGKFIEKIGFLQSTTSER